MTFVRSCADLKKVGDIIPNLTPPSPSIPPYLKKILDPFMDVL